MDSRKNSEFGRSDVLTGWENALMSLSRLLKKYSSVILKEPCLPVHPPKVGRQGSD